MTEKCQKQETGTREWAQYTLNLISGCGNNCIYCYANTNSVRRKQRKSGTWREEEVRIHDLNKKIKKYDAPIMFPSTHDIRPEHLTENLKFLEHILNAGNDVLIVSKPHLECINAICNQFDSFKNKILFRFTIGSANDEVLKFWEPNAPGFNERLASLKWAFSNGYRTSVSCEPMLDDKIDDVISTVYAFVTETIWIGKANGLLGKTGKGRLEFNGHNDQITISKAKELANWQEDSRIMQIYDKYKNDSKIMWKDSIKKILIKNKNEGT